MYVISKYMSYINMYLRNTNCLKNRYIGFIFLKKVKLCSVTDQLSTSNRPSTKT